MAVDPVPYVVHGAKHSADVFRQALHDSTAGAEGISLPGNLHVKQTGTPSNQVQVAPGGVLIPNTYSGGAGQSYSGRNASTTLVDVPASDSTGSKTWYIIFRVQDPQFGGPTPADPLVGPYAFIECVSASATISDPHYRLARIVVPANTATITNLMITSLRELANPRSKRVVAPRPNVTGDAGLSLTSSNAYPQGEWFPNVGGALNNGRYDIDVPTWATRMQIRCEWHGIVSNSNPGSGSYWVTVGPDGGGSSPVWYTQAFGWNSTSGNYMTNWLMEQEMNVRPEWRGTVLPFFPRANWTNKNSGGSIGLSAKSGMVFSVRFLEEADI